VLKISCFDKVIMSCTVYTMSCNFAIHAICPLALITYKDNELQVSSRIQKLNCKVSYKTFFFHNDILEFLVLGRNLMWMWLNI